MTKKEQIRDAIERAMRQWLENDGSLRPHNPAVIKGMSGEIYFSSALSDDCCEVVVDLDASTTPFGGYTPDAESEIATLAEMFIAEYTDL